MSVGLACFAPTELQRVRSTADQDINQLATTLIARADEAFYQAKVPAAATS